VRLDWTSGTVRDLLAGFGEHTISCGTNGAAFFLWMVNAFLSVRYVTAEDRTGSAFNVLISPDDGGLDGLGAFFSMNVGLGMGRLGKESKEGILVAGVAIIGLG